MKPRTTIQVLLTLLAAASVANAQEAKKAPAPASGTGQQAAPVKEASAVKAEPNQIVLYVNGLKKDNQTQVKEALTGLEVQRYVCSADKVEQAQAGKCPKCGANLKSEMHRVLSTVTVTPDDSKIMITPDASSTVKLSQIENALSRHSVTVDTSRLTIPGKATLVLQDGVADNAAVIEKALRDAKLFEEVRAKFDAASKELDVNVRAGTTAPTRTAVARTIDAAGTKAKLSDVIWGHVSKA